MKYRLYIDEVGNSDLEASDDPNHRFLSLTGVPLELAHIEAVVHPELEALKAKYFRSHPDDPVVFHRREMLNRRPPFEALRDENVRAEFDEELLTLLARWDYVVMTVCLDKRRHRETYSAWRYDPYHYCLAVLLERFALFLRRRNAWGDALAESRGGREDRRLKAAYERLCERGTEYVSPELFQSVLTSRQLKVKTKANNVAGLQICDLLAHPSRAELLNEHELGGPPREFAVKVIGVLRSKYDQADGRIFGKKLL